MDIRVVVAICVRLFSICLFVYSLRIATGIPSAMQGDEGRAVVWLMVLFIAICVALSVVLWKFPLTVAGKLVPRNPNSSGNTTIESKELEAVALSVLGMFFFFQVLKDALNWALFHLAAAQHPVMAAEMSLNEKVVLGSFCIRGVLSIWLLLGSPQIVRLLVKLRRA